MTSFGFIIDNRRCIGCHACTVACKSEHDVAVGVNRTWVKYIEKGEFPNSRRLFSVLRCNHCDNAPCVTICPVTALYRRDDGIVDFDNQRCIGCKACMQACPYDALYIDPDTHTAAKCNYCAHRVDVGLEPACVNVCPTHAIISGDLNDRDSEISRLKAREQVTARKVEKGTVPKLYYIDADDASLNPNATNKETESMWNEQVRGVGHYSNFMQDRLQESDSNASNGHSGVVDSLAKFLSLGEDGSGVLVNQTDKGAKKHGARVAQEVSRRTYDAPNKGILWGWQVTAYMWTKSIAAGAVLVPLLGWATGIYEPTNTTMWIGTLLALIFMALTGLLLRMDLDQPKRFLNVLLRPQWRSWLVKGAYIITAFVGLLLIWCVLMLVGERMRMWLDVTQYLLIGLATLTAIYTAFLFAQAKGRDFWQSPMLSVHMFAHAIMAGGAVFAMGLPFSNADWDSFVVGLTVTGILLHLISCLLELGTTHATEDARRAAHSITHGRYAGLFWGTVIVAGNVAPLAMLIWNANTGPFAGLIILAGIYFSEHIWVRAPQQIPLA